MIQCIAKPVKYEPSQEEFKCPNCGAPSGEFYIDDSECDPECERLHDTDYLRCAGKKNGYPCGYETSGKAFSAMLVKKNSMVKCEHCNGKGMVKKS